MPANTGGHPIGPETEAFFDGVLARMRKGRTSGSVPGPRDGPAQPEDAEDRIVVGRYGDLNADGRTDEADQAIFDAALGSCGFTLTWCRYNIVADFNLDGCITLADRDRFSDYLAHESRPQPSPSMTAGVEAGPGSGMEVGPVVGSSPSPAPGPR